MGPYGLGRAPSPLMHTLRVCIWVPLWGTHYRSRFIFLSFVARPLAFGSLPAPMGTLRVPICTTLWVVHIIRARYGCPKGHPIMGHPMGAPYVHPTGAHYFFLYVVARPLAFGSLPAPTGTLYGCPIMHTRWVCIWVPRWGTHYNT